MHTFVLAKNLCRIIIIFSYIQSLLHFTSSGYLLKKVAIPCLLLNLFAAIQKFFFWCWSANIPRHSLCYMISLLCTQFFVVCLRGFYFRHIMCMMILSYSSMIRGEEIYLGYDEFFGCINFCGKIF